MLDFVLLMLVGLVPASGALWLLDRHAARRVAGGLPPLDPRATTALHWLICVATITAVFVLGAVLAP